MEPTLAEGARVWFRPLGARPVRRGDVLLYLENARLVVHRVVGRHGDGSLRTKGDGRATFDVRPTSLDAVIGRVVGVERGGAAYSLEGRGARVYARWLALVSAVVGRSAGVAYRADAVLRRALRLRSERTLLAAVVGRSARIVLHVADRVLFPLLHARHPAPTESVPLASADPGEPPPGTSAPEGPSVGGNPGVE
jgi:hypothetical protein